MGMFGRLFGRGKDQPEGEGRQPEEAGQAPAPQPPAPAAPAPAEPKRRGLLGRAADRLRGRGKKEQPPAEVAPPAAPPAPPGPPSAPPTGGGEEGGEEGGEGGEEAEEEKDYSNAPKSLDVTIDGTWVTSKRAWRGPVVGTVKGSQVVDFLKALDEGREEEAVQMICDDFGDGSFGAAVDLSASDWGTPRF